MTNIRQLPKSEADNKNVIIRGVWETTEMENEDEIERKYLEEGDVVVAPEPPREFDEDYWEKLEKEREREIIELKRKSYALHILERAIRYVQGYLWFYSIDIRKKYNQNPAEVTIRVHWKLDEEEARRLKEEGFLKETPKEEEPKGVDPVRWEF